MQKNNIAILTIINGIPLFSTEAEALAWGSSRGLIGSHTHSFEGSTGYMGGINHNQALIYNPNITTQQQNTIDEEIINPNLNSNLNSGSSSGGGGGGY